MTEQEKRMYRCCFTGHRPEKLSVDEKSAKELLEKEIRKAVNDGYRTFISGMARGIDIWAAQIVLQIKKEGQNIHLICACPFEGFESSWSKQWQVEYRTILEKADLVKYISPSYSRSCFQVRNEWMVDHSNRVIAFYNGEPGGTLNTINYAERKKVEVVNLLNKYI